MYRHALVWLLFICGAVSLSPPAAAADQEDGPHFTVTGYTVEGRYVLSTNVLVEIFSKYSGTNVSLLEIIQAASDLELAYLREGYPNMNIVIAPKRIANGIVTLDVFPGAVPQIVVAGRRYLISDEEVARVMHRPYNTKGAPAGATETNVVVAHFAVTNYLISGNTVLPQRAINQVLTNVPGAFGTNVTVSKILAVRSALQTAYRERGFVTVAVELPQQRLTNATVKFNVVEGRLESILVKGNHYYSSNNVMRAIPGLYTNMLLNGLVFQEELNRANANQDRQIYPVVEPGPDPGTTILTLQVQDRLPLHAKAELNNENSPGTPELRLNTSATYNNLWDHENSAGVQYSMTPGDFKNGAKWQFYDMPQVVNYSAFYRMPLSSPEAIGDTISANPGTFGYSEATRRFTLPPASGVAEWNLYASRATIDTGLEHINTKTLYNIPGVRTIVEDDVQQDLTVNDDVGTRISAPLGAKENSHWDFSGGLDFKSYETASYKTNNFLFTEITLDSRGHPNPPVTSVVASPVPVTDRQMEYLPAAFSLSGAWRKGNSSVSWALGMNANLWYSGGASNLHNITGSTKSSGHWIVATPSVVWQFPIYTNWQTTIRADGQIASEPLISSEQFGAGGINSVRGYHEGEVFGDDGWHVGFEQLTPPQRVGIVFGKTPLILRESLYMDYAHTYLVDAPKGAADGVALWGTGVGCVASIGAFWEARFWFSLPLLKCPTADAYQPYFNFSLTGQF